MEQFNTFHLPQRRKLDFWNDISCRTFSSMEVVPGNKSEFDGALYTQRAGSLAMTLLESSAVRVSRTQRHISNSGDRRFILNCPVNGQFRLSQYGHELCVHEGEMVMMDNAMPYELEHDAFCQSMIVTISRELLRLYFPSPEQLIGLHLRPQPGLTNFASAMLRNLGREMKSGVLSGNNKELEKGVMEFITLAFREAYNLKLTGSGTGLVRRIAIRRYIEDNLGDPELTAGTIARAMRMSPRYLRMIFRQEQETVSAYILRRRLEECARQLADPIWDRCTISEIAFSRGFNNLTYFGQTFKRRYGVTPGRYRRRRGLFRI